MQPMHAWAIYVAIVILVVACIGAIVGLAWPAGRYDRRSDRLFEECKRHPELKDDDA